MPIDWAPFVDFVNRHERFLLTTHIRPDGDGLGSALALDHVLRKRGKAVDILIASSIPARYAFLDPEARLQRFSATSTSWRKADAVVVLDTGTWGQLGDLGPAIREMRAEKAVIDHHLTQDDLGATRYVDATAEATGRLVYDVARALGGPLDAQVAQWLLVALAMDTGWFRHTNTTARTFHLAAELEAAGARPTALYDQLFEQNGLPRLKLMGRALDRLATAANGRVAYTEIRLADYEACGAKPADSEDLINLPRSLAGVEVALVFMEQPAGGVKVSFRSRARVDVTRLAERFGGGGHRLASGATLPGTLEQAHARVLEQLLPLLEA